MPAVIFSHGFGGDHSVGDPYARFLASRGYVVYCFDFRGGSPQSLSDGSTLEMSIFTEQADLEAVIDAISQLNLVDKSRLYLMGTSQGGVVSSLAAAANPERIAGLILFYPAYVLVDEASRLFPDPASIPTTYHFMWMDVGRAYFEPLLDYDVYAAIAAYPKKVLIVHGDADRIVPLSYSQKATEVYADSRLVVIEGGGHGFSGNKQEQAMNEIWNYLEEQNA